MVIGVPTFRLRGVYFAIGTLGVAEVLRLTTANALPLDQRPAAPTRGDVRSGAAATSWRSALAAASTLAA